MSDASVVLPGEQYMPSNGSDGYAFIEEWCCNCAKDEEMGGGVPFDDCDEDKLCPILGASFRGEAVEWRRLEDGSTKCIAFVPAGQAIPAPRCPNTLELF